MDFGSEAALVEAVLFLENEPLGEDGLAKITKLSLPVVKTALGVLEEHYQNGPHGIQLKKLPQGWSLLPKEELNRTLLEHYGKRREERLSRAALETLSIIAYSQPLTRAEIEIIRGVGAEGMIKLLKDKDLIKEVGRKDTPGRPVLYGTTKEFLKIFRLGSIAELPKLDEVDQERFALNGGK